MKRTGIFVLSFFSTLCLVACSNTEAEPDTSVEPTEAENDFISEQYELGDILLSDGSIVKAADMTAIDNSNVPIAVIGGFKEDGRAIGIGVHRSESPLQWASDNSAGYAANFTDTACTQKSEFEFSGDQDGVDNWEVICAQDSEDTADAAKNYPAFHFVNTYAETYNLPGDLASGWYMPSIAELSDIYQNREAVNTSLQKIYEIDEQAAMDGLGTNWYWSSSQAGTEDDYAWFVHYFNGYAGECPKNFTNVHALAIREF